MAVIGFMNRWRGLDAPATDGGPQRMAEILLTDIADRIKEVLSRSRIFDLRRLQVEQEGDSLVISGRVGSFYHKQLAQELVRTAADGMEVINVISVVYHPESNVPDLDWTW
jgi:hypothetical protein